MDYSQTFAISAAGMTVERSRVDVAALNLANANTVQSVGGPIYQPMHVVARTSLAAGGITAAAFADQVDRGLNVDASGLAGLARAFMPQASVEPTGTPPRMVYEPGNPLADAKGFVGYAGVDSATEMVTMMSAMRSYEANVAAMNTAKTLAMRALDIGGTSS